MDPDASVTPDQPPVFNYILSFLLVGVAWGFTTPFIRRAAADFNARQEQHSQASPEQPQAQQEAGTEAEEQELQQTANPERESGAESSSDQEDHPPPSTTSARPAWMRPSNSNSGWLTTKITTLFWTVINLLRTPAYSVPLIINLTGSIWFFLLVGKHELSLTVPLANSSAFLFTVLGEWYVERKVIEKETWLGMVLVLGGIAICVKSKT
ncbi:hypothetical protein BDV29DRAFT_178830 [Aspergillus leporis]|uniref:Integral membrane protein n=1 Tax=Aspergillus leporis TaxID=41062 RepID=A0A5N5WWP8_9EURO|nr:hypothetical protein BDV29DRAFT_178830 [Aspergillus leporis]